jgi:hypothetical protein
MKDAKNKEIPNSRKYKYLKASSEEYFLLILQSIIKLSNMREMVKNMKLTLNIPKFFLLQ